MAELLGILQAIIDHIPWFVIAYVVHMAYSNKPRRISINFSDKFTIMSER